MPISVSWLFNSLTLQHINMKGVLSPRNSQNINQQQKLSQSVRISFLRRTSSNENLPQMPLPYFIQRSSFLGSKCKLCDESRSRQEMDRLGNCDHLFCLECLQKYCVYKINVMEDVTCPEEDCREIMTSENTVYARLPELSKEKFKRMLLWKQTISNPNLRLCPTENCEGVIDISHGTFECQKCKVKFCKQCQLPQHVGPCDVNFQANFKDWKRCPNCQLFIEKNEGCNHMTCRCGHNFCYVCLADWADEHYECGYGGFRGQVGLQIRHIPVWRRILLGVLMFLLFPLVFAILLAIALLGAIIASIVGFFCGPLILLSQIECLQNICCCVVCPLLMVIGGLIGLFGGLGYCFYLLFSIYELYFITASTLLCSDEEFLDEEVGIIDDNRVII